MLGGEYSVRGYDIRQHWPVGPRRQASLVIGGNKSLLFNGEYLIQVAGPVRLVLFYDAGQVRDSGQNFRMNEFVASTGAEVRFFMPVLNVPFRLIFARNINHEGILNNNLEPEKKLRFRFAVEFDILSDIGGCGTPPSGRPVWSRQSWTSRKGIREHEGVACDGGPRRRAGGRNGDAQTAGPEARDAPSAAAPAATTAQPPRPFPEGAEGGLRRRSGGGQHLDRGQGGAHEDRARCRPRSSRSCRISRRALQAAQQKLQTGGSVMNDGARDLAEKEIEGSIATSSAPSRTRGKSFRSCSADLQVEFQHEGSYC